MYGRELAEYTLLNRLSRIDDIRLHQSMVKQPREEEQHHTVSRSIPEIMSIYMSSIGTQAVIQTGENRQHTVEEKDSDHQSMMEVAEIYRIASRRREDAREHLHDKQAVKDHSNQIADKQDMAADAEDDPAYECLDCSRGESYLLYSYNAKGTHSLLGRDVRPGNYGGSITSGDFFSKA